MILCFLAAQRGANKRYVQVDISLAKYRKKKTLTGLMGLVGTDTLLGANLVFSLEVAIEHDKNYTKHDQIFMKYLYVGRMPGRNIGLMA